MMEKREIKRAETDHSLKHFESCCRVGYEQRWIHDDSRISCLDAQTLVGSWRRDSRGVLTCGLIRILMVFWRALTAE